MIDVEGVWENIFFQPRQQRMRIGRHFRWKPGQACHQFVGLTLRADGPVSHGRKMLNEQIDDAITEPLHLVRRQFQPRWSSFLVHAAL